MRALAACSITRPGHGKHPSRVLRGRPCTGKREGRREVGVWCKQGTAWTGPSRSVLSPPGACRARQAALRRARTAGGGRLLTTASLAAASSPALAPVHPSCLQQNQACAGMSNQDLPFSRCSSQVSSHSSGQMELWGRAHHPGVSTHSTSSPPAAALWPPLAAAGLAASTTSSPPRAPTSSPPTASSS